MFHDCLLSPAPSDGTLKNTMGAQSTAGLSNLCKLTKDYSIYTHRRRRKLHFFKLKDLVQENYFKF